MKKRILCAILALIMMISLVPVTAMNASAASMKTSDDAIKFIKQYESYSKTCYKDGDRYSIGYGTLCDKDHSLGATHTIEEIDASAALAEELPEIEKAVNAMGLSMTQNQFDALVSFSYNNGTAWIYGSGIWKNAVTGHKTGNEFLYAIGLWSNDSTGFSSGLMSRRLAEANMYLNGIYSKTPPANYTYVLFDANGGTLTNSYDSGSYKMQAFVKGGSVAIKASAKKTDATFMGWYTATTGGERVTSLTSDLAGKTLYARWQSTTSPAETVVSYTLSTSALAEKTVYDAVNGKVWTAQAGATSGETVKIIREQIDEQGVRWGRIEGSGWVKMTADAVVGGSSAPVVGAGIEVTVTNAYINLRPEPVATGAVLGKVTYGEKLVLEQVVTSHGALWGKTAKGWIALMYTNYNTLNVEVEQTPSKEDKPTATGTVSLKDVTSHLFVRSTPDATNNSNLTGKVLKHGDKVEIYEITLVNGVSWGRIANGWICLTYVKDIKEITEESGTGTGTGTGSGESAPAEKPVATGTVISNTPLNVRKVPTTVNNYPIGTKVRGTKLDIYEIKVVDNGGKHEWGRIGVDQWVCLDYVQYTLLKVEEENSGSDTGSSSGTSTGAVLYTGKTTTGVNIRKEADGTSEVIGKIPANKQISIQELALGTDIANGKGWAKVTYTEKVGEEEKSVTGWVYMGNVVLDPVNYTVVSKTLNVRPNAGTGTGNDPIDKLAKGTVVEISEIKMLSNTSLWGKSVKYGGWMCITSNYMQRTTAPVVDKDESTESEGTGSTTGGSTGTPVTGFTGTGVVNGAQLNVRSGPGMNYPSSNKLMPGSEIKIYEYVVSNGAAWGRTDYGWVCLSYVLITGMDITGAGQKATVANTYIGVNVRNTASTNSAILTKIMVNSRIEILETTTVNGQNWARTSLGWISMNYVLLDSAVDGDIDDIISGGAAGGTGSQPDGGNTSTGTPAPTGPSYAGKVTAETEIYKAADSMTVVGNKLAKDQAIKVYEIKNGRVRIDEGWVDVAAIKLDSIKQVYTVVSTTLNVRSAADASVNNVVGQLKKGAVVEVTDLAISAAGGIWGKVTYKNAENVTITGYICLTDKYVALGDLSVKEETPAPEVVPPATTPTVPTTPPATSVGGVLYTGTVNIWDGTAAKLKVRDTAGGAKVVDQLSPGVKVNIVEMTIINNMPWGKCGAGWICLTYVDLVPVAGAADARVVLYANTVTIYEGAGVHHNTVGTYAKGTVVDILEVNGGWVRTPMGWIEAAYLAP